MKKRNNKDKMKGAITELLDNIENKKYGPDAPTMSDFGKAFDHALDTGDTKLLNDVYKNMPREEMVISVSPAMYKLYQEALDLQYSKHKTNEQKKHKT